MQWHSENLFTDGTTQDAPWQCIKPGCGTDGLTPCTTLSDELNLMGTGCLPYHNLRSNAETPICVLCHSVRSDLYEKLMAEGKKATMDIFSRCDDFAYGCGYASTFRLGTLNALMVNPVCPLDS